MNKNLLDRIPSLDGLRAISIIMVMGSHILGTFPPNSLIKNIWLIKFLFNGDLGVKIFFLISGFIITIILLKEEQTYFKISLKNFFLRRLLRIIPTYYLYLLILLCLNNINYLAIPISSFLAAFTFTTALWGEPTWILGHSWSLSVEEQFYILWPFFLLFIRHSLKRISITILLILCFPIFRILLYFSSYKNSLNYLFITQADMILFGCLTGLIYYYYNEKFIAFISTHFLIIRWLTFITILLIYLMGVNLIFGYLIVPFGNTLQGILLALLIISLIIKKDFLYNLLNMKGMIYLGMISYGLYVWQQFFLRSSTYENELTFYTKIPLNIIFSLIFAIINYHLIEKKITLLKKYLVTNI